MGTPRFDKDGKPLNRFARRVARRRERRVARITQAILDPGPRPVPSFSDILYGGLSKSFSHAYGNGNTTTASGGYINTIYGSPPLTRKK